MPDIMMHKEVGVTVTMVAMVWAMVECDWEVPLNRWPLKGSDHGLYKGFLLEPLHCFPGYKVTGGWCHRASAREWSSKTRSSQ